MRTKQVFQQRFGYLFLRYKDNVYWWEIMIFLRKFFLFIFVLFVSTNPLVASVMATGTFAVFFFFQLIYQPYIYSSANTVETFLIAVDYIILSLGIMTYGPDGEDRPITQVLVLIFGILGLIVALCYNGIEFAYNFGFTRFQPFMEGRWTDYLRKQAGIDFELRVIPNRKDPDSLVFHKEDPKDKVTIESLGTIPTDREIVTVYDDVLHTPRYENVLTK